MSLKNRPPLEAFYIYILALMTGYMIADLGVLNVRPNLLPTQAPPRQSVQAPRMEMTSLDRYSGIEDRNLFNADGKIPPALTAAGGGQEGFDMKPVASQLPLTLEGTLVDTNAKHSIATIMVKAKNESHPYMVGDKIEDMAQVTKIERRKVIFRNLNNQRLEYIEIPKGAAVTFGMKASGPAAPKAEVDHDGQFNFTIRRSVIQKYTSDMGAVLQQARMVPNIIAGSGGRVEGFRFVAIQPGSIYEKLGFKPGDVIKGVNGEPINSPTKAMEMYNALKSDNQISLTVERDGQDQTFRYTIPE